MTAAVDDPRRRLGARLPLRPAALVDRRAHARRRGAAGARAVRRSRGWLDVVQLRADARPARARSRCCSTRGSGRSSRTPRSRRSPLELTARLDAAPPANVDVALVLAGAGAQHAAGLRGWLAQRRRRGLDRADVAILHLEPQRRRRLVGARRAALRRAPSPPARRGRAGRRARAARARTSSAHRARTGAGIARADGWAAIAVGADVEFALALVRELDSALGGGAGAADGERSSLRP